MRTKQVLYFSISAVLVALAFSACAPKVYIKSESYQKYWRMPTDLILVTQQNPTRLPPEAEQVIKEDLQKKGYQLARDKKNARFILSYSINQEITSQKSASPVKAAPEAKVVSYDVSKKVKGSPMGQKVVVTLTLSLLSQQPNAKQNKLWVGSAVVDEFWYTSRMKSTIRTLLDYLGYSFDDNISLN